MPYRLFQPRGIQAGKKYPLVVYLHGSGGSGDDNRKQYTGGNLLGSHVWALDENQQRYPAFVVAPQSDRGWAQSRRDPEGTANAPGARAAVELIRKLMAELPVDAKRVYVTGQSMGGAGSWYLATHYPGLFAAAVPVCGRGDPAKAAQLLTLPVWAFHGSADPTVPVTESRSMIEAMRKTGAKPSYTEYERVGHNSWEPAYTEPKLVDWVFSQHR